jgi:hypothetical protein
MPADIELITKTWQALQPALAQEKCAGCECLQGALVELKFALEELPGEAGPSELLRRLGTTLGRGEPHACLGCEPCNAGDILANFYREQQAREAATQAACCDG